MLDLEELSFIQGHRLQSRLIIELCFLLGLLYKALEIDQCHLRFSFAHQVIVGSVSSFIVLSNLID